MRRELVLAIAFYCTMGAPLIGWDVNYQSCKNGLLVIAFDRARYLGLHYELLVFPSLA